MRLALECRRRVKEQQKRIGAMEFRNTHFSYTLGEDGIEQYVTTPELQSPDEIGSDPLPPGQVWAISPEARARTPGLYRIDVTVGPGSGVRTSNAPVPAPFRESTRVAEQNLLTRVGSWSATGTRASTSFQRPAARDGRGAQWYGPGHAGLVALRAPCRARASRRDLRDRQPEPGWGIDSVPNAVAAAEFATEKGASTLLAPYPPGRSSTTSRRHATKVNVLYYADAREALLKAIVE